MRTVPNPIHRCRRCGHLAAQVSMGWKHEVGGSVAPTCGLPPDVVPAQYPYPDKHPRWSITPQGDGYVVRRGREAMTETATAYEACAQLLKLADAEENDAYIAGRTP